MSGSNMPKSAHVEVRMCFKGACATLVQRNNCQSLSVMCVCRAATSDVVAIESVAAIEESVRMGCAKLTSLSAYPHGVQRVMPLWNCKTLLLSCLLH
jgi:hypothetical protein